MKFVLKINALQIHEIMCVCVCLFVGGKSLPSRELLSNKGRDNCIDELRFPSRALRAEFLLKSPK